MTWLLAIGLTIGLVALVLFGMVGFIAWGCALDDGKQWPMWVAGFVLCLMALVLLATIVGAIHGQITA